MDNRSNEIWGRGSLGQLQDNWPKTPEGDFEEPAFLQHCASTDMEDELVINMLSAYGIPCVKQYPNNGRLGKVIMGVAGCGADLFVPSSMLEDARKLCEGVSEDEQDV